MGGLCTPNCTLVELKYESRDALDQFGEPPNCTLVELKCSMAAFDPVTSLLQIVP